MLDLSLDAQRACVRREIGLRHKVYTRLVRSQKMTQAEADEELALMDAVYRSLGELQEHRQAQGDLFAEQERQ